MRLLLRVLLIMIMAATAGAGLVVPAQAANGRTVKPYEVVSRSLKPISFGHYYIACASRPGLSNVCSPRLA